MLARLALLFALSTFCFGQTSPLAPTSPQPITITAAQVYTPSPNTQWVFQNGYGDLTFITQQAPTPSDYLPAGSINWVFQKNACRAYWGAGICDALNHFVLVQQPDGSWTSPATLFYFPTQIPAYMNGFHMMTMNVTQVPGEIVPYTIIPASATAGVTVSGQTQYDRWEAFGSYTFGSILSAAGSSNGRISWKTVSYIENVSTPLYTGPALVSDQYEDACIHEKWYFAPGLGLVKIVPLDNGSCTPSDPNLAIVKIS